MRTVLSLLVLSLLALGIALMLPGGKAPDKAPLLPWNLSQTPSGALEVFGLNLGETSLGEAEALFQSEAKLNLFRSPDDEFALEAYFQRLNLSGLRGDFILSLAIPTDKIDTVYERGRRISRLGSGTQKITLGTDDARALREQPIDSLTYIPATDLDPALIASRFGQPARKVAGTADIVHWLYPDKGLDIAVNPEGKEVLQYISPADFHRLTAPLSERP